MLRRGTAGLALVFLLSYSPVSAQVLSPNGDATPDLPAIVGPPAPVAPEVITRDADGRATVRAIRLSQPLRIDGALDEAHYRDVPPINGFIQIEPRAGEPATDQTDIWITFDNDNVYVSGRCWDANMDKLLATEMRRDNNGIFGGNDVILFLFDTFYDHRNGIALTLNAVGGRQDGQVSNERQYSGDFNPIWEVKTGRFDGGWSFEAVVPFKSLKYKSGRAQVWGVHLQRNKPSKNEISFLTKMPSARGRLAYQQISLAATLVGIEAPPPARNLEIKPYVTSDLNTDATSRPRISNDPGAAAGFDLKYGLTQSLTADFTVNTDFAQVEADEAQVNLTRFSLFFPEKRDFFLENVGIFSFGGVAASGNANVDAPTLFYSRRIGLNRGREVPLDVGGRLTGRVGRFTLGAVNIQTGDEPLAVSPSTNFSVLRVRRDLLQRSSVGLLYTGRSVALNGRGRNSAFGVDGTFAFLDLLLINTYWARTDTEGLRGDADSYRGIVDYPGDRYGMQVERLSIGDNFNPEVGFVRRDNMVRDFAQLRFSPRPRANRPISRRIRKFSYMGSMEYIQSRDGHPESREGLGEFALDFQNGDRFSTTYSRLYEFLPAPFAIGSGVTLPVGGYDFDNIRIAYTMSQRYRNSFNVSADYGTFYNGHKTTLSVSRGRMAMTPQLSVEPTYTINRIDLVQGAFTTHLGGSRVTYTMTPQMFTSALVQYSSATNSVSANVRLRWEYRPGSELFIVFNEQRDTRARAFPDLANRAFIVKVNRLFRF